MKITCHCGHLIPDQTDDLAHKGHVIPDQEWNSLWEFVDDQVLAKLASRMLTLEGAAMRVRQRVGSVARTAYQCRECGRLYINDKHGKLHCYIPHADSDSRSLFGAEG